MSRRSWRQPIEQSAGANETTRAHVIETIESESPETKAELADALGVSEHAVSRLLSDLKREGIVSKGYVVDPEAVYESAESVSELHVEEDSGRRSSLLTGPLRERSWPSSHLSQTRTGSGTISSFLRRTVISG